MFFTTEFFFFFQGGGAAPAQGIVGTILFENEKLNGVAAQGIVPSTARSNLTVPPLQPIAANSEMVYECDLIDLAGNQVDSSMLSGLTLSITESDSYPGTPINGVIKADILTPGGRGLLMGNHLTVTLDPADNPLIGAGPQELHSITIDAAWGSAKGARHEAQFLVAGLSGA